MTHSKPTAPDPTLVSVIERQRPVLLAVARRELRDEEAAEDLVQDTIAGALGRPSRGGEASSARSCSGLLFKIFRNKMVDELRRRGRWADPSDPLSIDHAPGAELARPVRGTPQHRRTPLAELVTVEARDALERAVEALPELERDAIRLTYLEGDTLREAAEQLSLPTSTLAGARERGLARMRRSLGERTSGSLPGRAGFSPEKSTPRSDTWVDTSRHTEREDVA